MRPRPLALAAWLPLAGLACGYCIEDKMAATYDHAVVTRALERGHAVAFTEVFGLAEGDTGLLAELSVATEAQPAVDRGTPRVSPEPAALSFAFDPRRERAETLLAQIEQRLAPKGVKLGLIRVVDRIGLPDAR